MRNIWFTADLHFGHSNIVKYSNRPFKNTDGTIDTNRHDRTLIANWNAFVKPGDDVYFLGDFCYRSKNDALDIRKKLNGNIFFIEGNHDSAAHQIRESFVWFKQLHRIKADAIEIVLCHYAMRVWDKSHYGVWNLYGHSHNSLPEDMNALSIDVGVDAVAMRLAGKKQGDPIEGTLECDYRPLNIHEIAEIMKTKTFAPIDHHGKDRHSHNDTDAKTLVPDA